MDIRKFMDSLKMKKLKKNQIFILFLSGVLLMIIAIPVKEKESDFDIHKTDGIADGCSVDMADSMTYTRYLEQSLEEMLSQMEGAGKVACMVTLEQSAEQVIEKDREVSNDMVTESDSQGGTRTTKQLSESEKTIYQEGDSGVPYVRKEISPKVKGVLVIAEGGNNAVVVKNITESVQALFGIESHKIRIVKKGGN